MIMKNIISLLCFIALTAIPLSARSDKEAGDRIVLGEEIAPKDSTRTRRLRYHLIAPKGEWQCGLSVMYADFSSENSDYMMLLQGVGASASILRLAPEGAYTYADNHAVGARFQYTNVNGMVDSATADLLGNFSMTLEDLDAASTSMSGLLFHRTYVGLDGQGRVGVFWDYVFGYTRNRTQFSAGEGSDSFSIKHKLHLDFSPGIVYFPMNNVSIQACISLADISYSRVNGYEAGELVGRRQAWKAQASLNVLNLAFGLTVHF